MTSITGRLAGKALADFLKVATVQLSQGVEKAVLNKIGPTADLVDAPGLAGIVARNPETIATLAGAAAPAAVGGGLVLGAGLLGSLAQSGDSMYSQSEYSLPVTRQGTPVAYANQQYIPGTSPITNKTASEVLLGQQKFEQQMQLIQARQAAQQNVGIAGRSSMGLGNPMGAAYNAINAPVPHYG